MQRDFIFQHGDILRLREAKKEQKMRNARHWADASRSNSAVCKLAPAMPFAVRNEKEKRGKKKKNAAESR
jgi:hypothetical protein